MKINGQLFIMKIKKKSGFNLEISTIKQVYYTKRNGTILLGVMKMLLKIGETRSFGNKMKKVNNSKNISMKDFKKIRMKDLKKIQMKDQQERELNKLKKILSHSLFNLKEVMIKTMMNKNFIYPRIKRKFIFLNLVTTHRNGECELPTGLNQSMQNIGREFNNSLKI